MTQSNSTAAVLAPDTTKFQIFRDLPISLEIGLRTKTGLDWQEVEKKLGSQRFERVQWDNTDQHQGGLKMVASTLNFEGNKASFLPSALEILQQRAGGDTCVMLKLTGAFNENLFAAAALGGAPAKGENPARVPKLYTFDPMLDGGAREDGTYVYSIPMHHFYKVGQEKFFFAMAFWFDPETDKYNFKVIKVYVKIIMNGETPAFEVSREDWVEKRNISLRAIENLIAREVKLQNLPTAEFTEACRAFSDGQ